MAYVRGDDDLEPLIAHGAWEGHIVSEPAGGNGFGYDPVFYVPTHACTSAQLPAQVKNSVSHRGQALRKLVEMMKEARELG